MKAFNKITYFAVISCHLLALAAVAKSRDNHALSLEWLAGDSDAILRGKIVDVISSPSNNWTKIRVHIEETYKGVDREFIEFAAVGNPKEYIGWHGHEILAFLVESERESMSRLERAPCDLMLPRFGKGWSTYLLDAKDDSDIFAIKSNFELVSGRSALLAATRATVNAHGSAKTKRCEVFIPFNTQAFDRIKGGRTPSVDVPYDQLEGLAREWVKSENPYCRVAGVMGLSRFRSQPNELLLRSLLTDPALHAGRFLVRSAAYNILKHWGVECPQPVLELPTYQGDAT